MRSFDPVRNEDGSLSFFRIGCLGVAALCMFSYAMLMLGCASTHDDSLRDAGSADLDDSAMIEEEKPDDSAALRVLAVDELKAAESYYRDCGALNKGFEGCVFKFSPDLLARYEMSETAADDGFAVSMRLKDPAQDPKCTLLKTDSSGLHEAFDSEGKENLECWPAEHAAASGDNVTLEAHGAS